MARKRVGRQVTSHSPMSRRPRPRLSHFRRRYLALSRRKRDGEREGDIKNTTTTTTSREARSWQPTTAQRGRRGPVARSPTSSPVSTCTLLPSLGIDVLYIFPRRHADDYGRGQRSRHGQHLRGILRSTTPHIPM